MPAKNPSPDTETGPAVAFIRGNAAVLRGWPGDAPPKVEGVTLKHDPAAGGWIFRRADAAKVIEAIAGEKDTGAADDDEPAPLVLHDEDGRPVLAIYDLGDGAFDIVEIGDEAEGEDNADETDTPLPDAASQEDAPDESPIRPDDDRRGRSFPAGTAAPDNAGGSQGRLGLPRPAADAGAPGAGTVAADSGSVPRDMAGDAAASDPDVAVAEGINDDSLQQPTPVNDAGGRRDARPGDDLGAGVRGDLGGRDVGKRADADGKRRGGGAAVARVADEPAAVQQDGELSAPRIEPIRGNAAVLRGWPGDTPPDVPGVKLTRDDKAGGWIFARKHSEAVQAAVDRVNKETKPAPVAAAAAKANAEPTEGQKEAGNYAKGHARWNGLALSVENAKGSERSGKGPDGKPWSVTMPAHYGYFKGSEASDGDHVDFYMGPNEAAPQAWVIDQVDADTGAYDEAKVMLGYDSAQAAREAHEAAFSDGRGAERRGGIRKLTIPELKEWLASERTKEPVSPRVRVAEKARSKSGPAVVAQK